MESAEGRVCQRSRGISTHAICLYTRPKQMPSRGGKQPLLAQDLGYVRTWKNLRMEKSLWVLKGHLRKIPGQRNPHAEHWPELWAMQSLSQEPWLRNGGSGWPASGWSREVYQRLKCRRAAARSQDHARPGRALRPSGASEFRLRGARVGAISGVSCRRGNLKSRRLSRAALPHGGPPGEEGQVHRPHLHRFGDTRLVLLQPGNRATSCARLQPPQVPLPSCLPSTWTQGVSSEAAWPYRGAS